MRQRQILELLRAYESRNMTFVEPDGSWPICWERAQGVHVWDADGKRYVDLTAAFGVAAAGHANPRVVKAGQRQMARLVHAMGDVHPHAMKARLARELSRITFERWPRPDRFGSRKGTPPRSGKTIFCNSGFEAVEAALKTAMLATGKPGVIAFRGAYHGLGYGALNTTDREHFRAPFLPQLREFGRFVPFPKAAPAAKLSSSSQPRRNESSADDSLKAVEADIRGIFKSRPVGAILVEPIQVRGGVNVPPPQFLALLRALCSEHQALLILDEIYTGFGRTGAWFACEHSRVVPDLICLGKALTGGYPLSACVGRADIMDGAWPPSTGEAIHTSTFLGNPVGCAMALANLQEIQNRNLVARSATLGNTLLEWLQTEVSCRSCRMEARGEGLLVGLELRRADGTPATKITLKAIKLMLRRGFILLPEGEHANVISFTPPLTITKKQLSEAVRALDQVLHSDEVH